MKEIYSTERDFRFIGWSARNELILAATKEVISGVAVDLELVALSMDGHSRTLHTLHAAYPRTITLSFDRQTLAFAARRDERDDIWTISTDTAAEPRRITSNGSSRLFLTNLVFSADGKTIYYDKQEEINTISMFENFN